MLAQRIFIFLNFFVKCTLSLIIGTGSLPTSPILPETIEDHNDIKEKKGANFRLFTADPSSSDSTVHIISNREYDMIEKGIVKSDILDNPDELESRQKEIHINELQSLLKRIKKKYKIVNNENIEIDLSEIKLLPCKPTNMFGFNI